MRRPIFMKIPSKDFVEDQPIGTEGFWVRIWVRILLTKRRARGHFSFWWHLFTLSYEVLGAGLGAVQPCSY